MPGVTRIGPKRKRRVFLAAWRDHRGLTQKQLGERLGVTDMTVSRWETGGALLNTSVMAALAEALDIEPQDLFRSPTQPSADALLRDQSPEVIDQAIRLIQAIRR